MSLDRGQRMAVILGSLKRQPSPAGAVKSNYFAANDVDTCDGCGICVGRCQMEAVALLDDRAIIDLKRCIGCGLCQSTCPTRAMKLLNKEADQQYRPPDSVTATFIKLAAQRGIRLLLAR